MTRNVFGLNPARVQSIYHFTELRCRVVNTLPRFWVVLFQDFWLTHRPTEVFRRFSQLPHANAAREH